MHSNTLTVTCMFLIKTQYVKAVQALKTGMRFWWYYIIILLYTTWFAKSYADRKHIMHL